MCSVTERGLAVPRTYKELLKLRLKSFETRVLRSKGTCGAIDCSLHGFVMTFDLALQFYVESETLYTTSLASGHLLSISFP
jgi:hypothetical protein